MRPAAPTEVRSRRVKAACVAGLTVIAMLVPDLVAGPGSEAQEVSVPEAAPLDPPPVEDRADPDDQLAVGLEAAVALSPPESCLVVEMEGDRLFAHNEDLALVPASTHKLLTAAVALDVLGPDHRFATSFVAHPPREGIIDGDVALVGGGDPLLTTVGYALARRISPDEPLTALDLLADQVAASGVTHIKGSVFGDESRYDTVRTVGTWPDRYIDQEQIGPLSALTVDDGYRLVAGTDDARRRERSGDPAGDAARTFAELLRQRGIVIEGLAGAGPAPTGTEELTSIESAPLLDLVDQLLRTSDNGTAELITKELGLAAGTGGTTAAGVEVLGERGRALGLIDGAAAITDGSGLDPGNRRSCGHLVGLLERVGGPDGAVGEGLPVAGETGTLSRRFHDSAAKGRLRAKTGSLNSVTTLAGYVELVDGSSLTFAYMANGAPVTAELMSVQEWLGAVLALYEPACAPTESLGVIAPQQGPLSLSPGLAAGPVAPLLALLVAANLEALERHPEVLASRCLAAAPGFEVVLR